MFGFLGFWIFGILDVWILGSFACPVLLFDTNAASENEPKSDQQKSRFRTSFYSVLKGSACRGGDICTYPKGFKVTDSAAPKLCAVPANSRGGLPSWPSPGAPPQCPCKHGGCCNKELN